MNLHDWAKQTLQFYLDIVKEVGEVNAVSFYNQSKLYEGFQPQMLIIGYNPGAGCGFSKWEQKDKLDDDFLLKGNDFYWSWKDEEILHEYKTNWDIWKKIHKMLSYADQGNLLEDLRNFAFTNMVFFGTETISEIPKKLSLYQVDCARWTLKLIPLLKPRVVLLNGCANLFEKATGKKLSNLVAGSISYYIDRDTLYLAIKHTAFKYTNEELELIGKVLGYSLGVNPIVSPETINRLFTKEVEAYVRRVSVQKTKSLSDKTYRQQLAKEITEFLKNKYAYELSPKGVGNKPTKEGIYLFDRQVEVYTTDTKNELLQFFYNTEKVNICSDVFKSVHNLIKKTYQSQAKGSRLFIGVGKSELTIDAVMNNIMPLITETIKKD